MNRIMRTAVVAAALGAAGPLAMFAAIDGGSAASAEAAPVDSAEVIDLSAIKFHPVEVFTVEYELTGSETGKTVEHWRDWGHSRVEIRSTIRNVDPAHPVNERIITTDHEVTIIDEITREGAVTDNPEQVSLIQDSQDEDPIKFADKLMMALGGTKTETVHEYAGEACTLWTFSELAEQCVTDDGIVLYSKAILYSLHLEQKATEIRRGDAGPDSAFEIDDTIEVIDMPAPPGAFEGRE